ncbi:hypothetical protein CEXT_501421 [Caerostris extrusa]|uniref:Uncharacterized protein n=1 Tax=Caerostris extrusa TaxID=172846 RepID=A0AAV4RGY7_CAEEX|nr:hypothetical protein CEXT_501421 [Caerostris extrusa]
MDTSLSLELFRYLRSLSIPSSNNRVNHSETTISKAKRFPTPDVALESVAGILNAVSFLSIQRFPPVPYLAPLDCTHSSLRPNTKRERGTNLIFRNREYQSLTGQ